MHHKEVTDILPYIKECYSSEPELLPLYHVAGNYGVEGAAIYEATNSLNDKSKCYIVENDNNEFIGYFITGKLNDWNMLNSFYLLPQFRDDKLKFFDLIKQTLNDKFLLILKENNPRAIKFIEKLNGKKYYKSCEDIYFKVGEF